MPRRGSNQLNGELLSLARWQQVNDEMETLIDDRTGQTEAELMIRELDASL